MKPGASVRRKPDPADAGHRAPLPATIHPGVPDLDEFFLHPRCTHRTLDTWLLRTLIRDAVLDALPKGEAGVVIDLGCGFSPYRPLVESVMGHSAHYVGVDIPTTLYSGAAVCWDGRSAPFTDASAQVVMLTEVLEHCDDPSIVLDEATRLLSPGGRLITTVPAVWPTHNAPWDFRRFTANGLARMLSSQPLEEVRIQPLGGWNATMAQLMGLWIRRGGHNSLVRRPLELLAPPVLKWIASHDRRADPFSDNAFFLGLTATAVRTPAVPSQ